MSKNQTIVCRACQTEKLAEHFRVQSREKTGRDTLCNECRSMHRRLSGEYLRQSVYTHAKRVGQAVPYVTVDDFIDIFEAYKDCPYCGVTLDDTNRSIDHVFPLSSEYGGKRDDSAMARRSNRAIRESKLTRWQKRKEKRKKSSEDYKNGQRFFNLIKNDEKGAN